MKVEVWSDYLCPFCYMGKRKFELALNRFEQKDDVNLVFRSFELDPDFAEKTNQSIYEIVAHKYRIPVESAKIQYMQIAEQAAMVGLHYNFDSFIPTNVFKAHRLMHYAKSEGKMREMSDRIFKALFTDSLNISDNQVLIALASDIGLDKDKVLEVLTSDLYGKDVIKDEADAHSLGITGVPYFVFNNKYAVSGAQSPETFLEVLEKVRDEEFSAKEHSRKTSDKGLCSDGTCTL